MSVIVYDEKDMKNGDGIDMALMGKIWNSPVHDHTYNMRQYIERARTWPSPYMERARTQGEPVLGAGPYITK